MTKENQLDVLGPQAQTSAFLALFGLWMVCFMLAIFGGATNHDLFMVFAGVGLLVVMVLGVSLRRVLRVVDGSVSVGYGVGVPFVWRNVRPVPVAVQLELVLAGSKRGARSVVVRLWAVGPNDARHELASDRWDAWAKLRSTGEAIAEQLQIPFDEQAAAGGWRDWRELDQPFRERMAMQGFKRHEPTPPPGLRVRRKKNRAKIRLDGGEGSVSAMLYSARPLAWVIVGFMVFLPLASLGAADLDGQAFVALLAMEAAFAIPLVHSYRVERERGETFDLELTRNNLVAHRRWLFARPRRSIALADIEHIHVLDDGPLAQTIVIVSDDHVLLIPCPDRALREFVATYVAQWVVYGPPPA